MQSSPRNGASIDKLVLHTNEGPESENGAAGLAGYLNSIDGGYHAIFDDQHTVTTAGDDAVVWGAGGMNTHGLHGCFIHYSADQWTDPYSAGELAQAAAWFAGKCRQYGIPAVRLTPAQVATPGVKGICGHVDVSAVFPASMGHTDPGPNFPWVSFLEQVNGILNPGPKLDFAAIRAIGAFVRSLTKRHLREGDHGRNVKKLNGILTAYGYHVGGDVYGPRTVNAIADFKARHQLPSRDGKVCGRRCAIALFRNLPKSV